MFYAPLRLCAFDDFFTRGEYVFNPIGSWRYSRQNMEFKGKNILHYFREVKSSRVSLQELNFVYIKFWVNHFERVAVV